MIAALGEAARIARVEAVATLFHLLRLKRRLVKALKRGCGALNLETDKDKAFIRFNGPERSSDDMEITSDLSLLEMILKQPSSSSSSSSKEQKGVTTEDWMKYSESCKYEDGEDEKDADLIKRPKVFSAMSGTLVEQLPNTVSVSFRNVHTQQLMPLLLSRVACSAGSACHSEAASGDILALCWLPCECQWSMDEGHCVSPSADTPLRLRLIRQQPTSWRALACWCRCNGNDTFDYV